MMTLIIVKRFYDNQVRGWAGHGSSNLSPP